MVFSHSSDKSKFCKTRSGKVASSGSSSGTPGPSNTPRNNTGGGTGNTTRRSGQTLADYNMNPGNLRFANQRGAVNENGWAKFSNPQDGIAALENQITLDARRGDNIRTFIEDYAPRNENDTEAYIRHMASTLGVSEDTSLTDIIASQGIRAIAKAIAMKEDGNYYNTIKDLF